MLRYHGKTKCIECEYNLEQHGNNGEHRDDQDRRSSEKRSIVAPEDQHCIIKVRGGEREGILQFSLTAADGDILHTLHTPGPALVLLPGAEVPADGPVTAVAPSQHSITREIRLFRFVTPNEDS